MPGVRMCRGIVGRVGKRRGRTGGGGGAGVGTVQWDVGGRPFCGLSDNRGNGDHGVGVGEGGGVDG